MHNDLIIGNPKAPSVEGIKSALEAAPSKQEAKILHEVDGENSGYGPIRQRYERMTAARQPALDEARRMSAAIMPFLYPPEGTTDVYALDSANQSLIAAGVQNLAYALTATICPPNAKFFARRLLPSLAKSIEAFQAQLPEEEQTEMSSVLAQNNNDLVARDETIRQFIKTTPDVENFDWSMVHAIVAGEVVFGKPTLDTSKVYTLENFVAEFDSAGDQVEVIVRDFIHPSKFSPEDLETLFGSSDLELYDSPEADITEIPVYTRQIRRFDHWEIQVEVAGQRFKKMEGQEELDSPPFIALPFFLFPNHKYGVAWCTYNKGAINQFENVSLSLNEMIKIACDYHVVVPPESKITQAELAAPGPKYHFGTTVATQLITADIAKNLQVVEARWEKAAQEIMRLFLMNEAVRREAERVTKEEIQTMMQGLRNLLGGLYLSTARRFQRPYAARMDRLMVRAGRIPELPSDSTELVLTAGVETLEAVEELNAHDQWMARVSAHPEGQQRVNISEYALRTANQLQVNADELWLGDAKFQKKLGVDQLIATSQQLGPGGPQMLAMIVQQMMANPEAAQGAMQDAMGSMTQPAAAA
jgi:hypothetical protein